MNTKFSILCIPKKTIDSLPILKNQRGDTLLGLLIASSILAIIFMMFIQLFGQTGAQNLAFSQKVMAETYTVELIELFRSMSGSQIKAYMSTNPYDATLPPYFLCAHINLLDRTDNVILNNDPLANLPPVTLLNTPNRFYQVEVMDLTTMVINRTYCNLTAKQIYFFGNVPAAGETVQLGQYERLLITVGVSWQVPAGTIADGRVTAVTPIPN